MVWIAGISVWVIVGGLVALAFGRAAAPANDVERQMEDEAQVAALRECNKKAHAKLYELDELKAKIAGREA